VHATTAAADLGCQLAGVLLQAGRPGEMVEVGTRLLSLVEGRDDGREARVHVLLARAHIGQGARVVAGPSPSAPGAGDR
jgi:hypothetical protein